MRQLLLRGSLLRYYKISSTILEECHGIFSHLFSPSSLVNYNQGESVTV